MMTVELTERCLFVERRDTVYAVFSRMLERELLED